MLCLPLRSRTLIILGIGSVFALLVFSMVIRVSKESIGGSGKTGAGGISLRHIEYRFNLHNDSNQLIEKAELWTYGPVKATARQKCQGLKASHPYEVTTDPLGNQVLHFAFQNLPPFATKLIHIQADVELSRASRVTDAAELSEFLKREDHLETDSPEILQLAKKLKGRKALDTARNIFQWVSENLRFTGYQAAERGALYALKNGQGDCTEYMSLFVALCRASGIPARGVGGYIIAGDTILKPGDYHNWAEFHGDGTWHLADPQKRVFEEHEGHYLAMRIISNSAVNPMGAWNRFRSAGEGLKVRMEP
jgi:hypothetical protein